MNTQIAYGTMLNRYDKELHISIDEEQYKKKISLKSIILNSQLNITDYFITFEKFPSRKRLRKFFKIMKENFKITCYGDNIEINKEMDIRYFFRYLDQSRSIYKHNTENCKKVLLDKHLVYRFMLYISKGDQTRSDLTIIKDIRHYDSLLYDIMIHFPERTVFVNFENIEF